MELSGRIAGRGATAFVAEMVRGLEEEDLLLRRATPVGSTSPPIAKLRYQHHKLAQLLANGTGEGEASLITGYSISRISILKADPAFKQLLSHYIGVNQEVFIDLQHRMAGLAGNALDEQQDRLDETPEVITNKELIEAAKVANDRGGNNPVQRTLSTNIVLTPADIAEIKKEVKGLENGRIIEGELAPSDPEPSLGTEPLLRPDGVSEDPAQGLESEGQNL